ncbi:hypothetical protein PR048_014577 [Dryococelus australis]|uniref:Uncharacterized protein n=1 Tax=Dryococelus australis TaxID=614101 RepID=A0ABQ9HEL8_9NEOP|nr:hypothetical protein PR048_014577 [Dryococelus australis]
MNNAVRHTVQFINITYLPGLSHHTSFSSRLGVPLMLRPKRCRWLQVKERGMDDVQVGLACRRRLAHLHDGVQIFDGEGDVLDAVSMLHQVFPKLDVPRLIRRHEHEHYLQPHATHFVLKGFAYLKSFFFLVDAEKSESDKGDTATCIKCAIAAKRKAGVCSGPYTTHTVVAFVSLCGLRKFPLPDHKEHIAQRSGRPARPGATQTARQSDQQSRGRGENLAAYNGNIELAKLAAPPFCAARHFSRPTTVCGDDASAKVKHWWPLPHFGLQLTNSTALQADCTPVQCKEGCIAAGMRFGQFDRSFLRGHLYWPLLPHAVSTDVTALFACHNKACLPHGPVGTQERKEREKANVITWETREKRERSKEKMGGPGENLWNHSEIRDKGKRWNERDKRERKEGKRMRATPVGHFEKFRSECQESKTPNLRAAILPTTPLHHGGAESFNAGIFVARNSGGNVGEADAYHVRCGRLVFQARPVSTLASHHGEPAGSPDFRKWESCRTMPLMGSFSLRGPSRGSPVYPRPFIHTTRLPQSEPGSIPGGTVPDFRTWELCRTMSLVGGFSRGSPVSHSPCIPALLHAHLASPSSALKNSMLRATQISSLTLAHSQGRWLQSLQAQSLNRE